jgi:asparagine synthase (glutamine-hydrolysing)
MPVFFRIVATRGSWKKKIEGSVLSSGKFPESQIEIQVMCGIAGIFGPSFLAPFPLSALRHRGPDAEGQWRDSANQIWLGHRRLSILDLTPAGHQPMNCLEGRYQVVFNGEIYNFLELKKELQSRGYTFRTQSDTEVIPAAYDCWGIDCLHRFNGMWAFALWNNQIQELILSRDRFGKKPLYYCTQGEDLVFASEVKTLHIWLGPQARFDEEVIRSICVGEFAWHGTDRTYLAEVRSLPAGHCLVKSGKSLKIFPWYPSKPNRTQVPQGLAAQAEALRELLRDACQIRLRSDVPVATCLSGGLDSASVAAMIHRGLSPHGGRTAKDFHRAFSATFPQTILDEAKEARSLAQAIGASFIPFEIPPPSPALIEQAIDACDGPMHALAFYPIWNLYAFIRQHGVKVTLDGQGPDEMMGGYAETIQSALRSALARGKIRWFWDIYRTYGAQGENPYRSSRAMAHRELIRLAKAPLSKVKQAILNGNRPDQGNGWVFASPTPRHLSPLRRELYTQFFQKQLPTILQQYDRCSMAHGVECRMPFMDFRIVEFIFSLPEESLVGGGFSKRVLREAVRGLVPDSTRLNNVKIGFNAPIVEWFLGPLRELMLDTMSSRDFQQAPFFDGPKLVHDFQSWLKAPNWDQAWAFWPPVHFVLWQKRFRSQAARETRG